MPQTDRWNRAKELFEAATARPAGERQAFLRGACGGDEELRREVESLLAWHDDTRFLETPVARVADFVDVPSDDPLIGTCLGPWRLSAVLGQGGMGTVYRAERADGAYDGVAAVKIVRRGVATPEFIERFRLERRALAALDHPNIARLLDAGQTPAGQPYFVMELVDGMPITRFCDARRLDLRARLRMFVQVCAAVRYAHQQLTVHRDIKPDNILVTAAGVPKLLDFGIARLLEEGAPALPVTGAAAVTWLMTPDYASPEQVHGRPVTTSADVYSLGVLLFVLATARRPFRFASTTPLDLRAEIDTAVAPRPSEVVGRPPDEADSGTADDVAARLSTTPARLSRQLRGDLDAIVARAMAKQESARYGSVEELAADVTRTLRLYPVQARPATLGYVSGRFMRRHRTSLTLAAVAVGAVVVSLAVTVRQMQLTLEAQGRAARRFADVRALARTFMFDVHDAIVNVPGTTEARGLLVRTTVAYLDRLAAEASDDRSLQRELAAAYVKVGDAQGHPTSANLGDTAGARASYERAVGIAAPLAAGGDSEAQATLALAHRRLGDVLGWSGDVGGSLEHMRLSRQEFADLAQRDPASAERQFDAAVGEIKLGDVLGNPNFPNAGRPEDALTHYDTALASLRRLFAEHPDVPRTRRYVGLTLERIGTMREQAQAFDAAQEAYAESFAIRQALANEGAFNDEFQRDLAIAFEKLGNIKRSRGDLRGAVTDYRGALAQFERLARADPSNAIAARSVAISREKLAEVLARAGDASGASAMWAAARDGHRALADKDADNAQARCDLARTAEALGDQETVTASACRAWREAAAQHAWLARRGVTTCATADAQPRLASRLSRCGGPAQ